MPPQVTFTTTPAARGGGRDGPNGSALAGRPCPDTRAARVRGDHDLAWLSGCNRAGGAGVLIAAAVVREACPVSLLG